ncbi:DUF2283 domain-containing protein [Microcystis aeruginosa]|jgi:uncharacterized protein YuzE|uniref:DUF2283 domain-containing protein n=2 Tax=Microcystis TaxID=1125 RepID=A0A552IFM9_9CHRO|nr:DUF2283 domain-containing protein [Microcystis aeruginosa]QGZ92295.1 DUF2283 domain-containing protein [Microcystis aeruginosa FD4]TRU82268.1 MAG: DUF2283 domain-containing protein [Microcystis novacekii Mn_MB_F_20050700_S1D]TRU90837.1 MAG: DUF2283 domain-containing protein [Microcystis novacekii Mn_MB_F_20050700_S1]
MKLQYFKDTDTLYLEFKNSNIIDTRELDENTLLEIDDNGNICAITLEHASERTDINHLTTEGIAV